MALIRHFTLRLGLFYVVAVPTANIYLEAWSRLSCCCVCRQLAAAFNTRRMFPSDCQTQLMYASIKFKFTASKSHLKLRAWISVRHCRFPGAVIERWCTWPTSRKPTTSKKMESCSQSPRFVTLALSATIPQLQTPYVSVCVSISHRAGNLATLHIIFP